MSEVAVLSRLSTFTLPPPQLLATKLYAPRVRRDRVPRPILVSRLNDGLQHKLTLISAPAGCGKTTLLSEWCEAAAQQPISVGWVSLDEGDNDIVRFLAYFVGALQTIRPRLGEYALMQLYSPQLPSVESILTGLINEIMSIPGEFAIIFDDCHLIESRSIHAALEFLLEHLPPHMHVFCASRTELPLLLPRLRARTSCSSSMRLICA